MENTRYEHEQKVRYLQQRVLELDSLCLEIQAISGYTVEQLRDLFLAGYTIRRMG